MTGRRYRGGAIQKERFWDECHRAVIVGWLGRDGFGCAYLWRPACGRGL
jgi:hypothetical protein